MIETVLFTISVLVGLQSASADNLFSNDFIGDYINSHRKTNEIIKTLNENENKKLIFESVNKQVHAKVNKEIYEIKVKPIFKKKVIVATKVEEEKKPIIKKQASISVAPNPVTVPAVPSRVQPAPVVYNPPPAVQSVIPTPVLIEEPVIQEPTGTHIAEASHSSYTISIPKLGLNQVPIIPTSARGDNWEADLRNGVGQLMSFPGFGHKIVIFGHSSGYSWDNSSYKEVFRYLQNLNNGDVIYIDYAGKRYSYEVYKEEIVPGDEVSILIDYNWEELILFTCYPYQSWAKRYVIYAKPHIN